MKSGPTRVQIPSTTSLIKIFHNQISTGVILLVYPFIQQILIGTYSIWGTVSSCNSTISISDRH